MLIEEVVSRCRRLAAKAFMVFSCVGFAVLPVSAQTPIAGSSILGVQVNVESVVATGYRATKLIGSKIQNDKGQLVGTVNDLIIAGNGKVTLAILAVGGFVGIGAKFVAVPTQLFKPGEGGKIVLPGATKDELSKMPEFKYAK